MPREAKTVATHPGEEESFIRKAQDFLEGAEQLWTNNNHQGAAVLAIHSAISSCDALTAKLLSCRHRGENHIGVVDLLKKLPLQNKTELNNRIRQVKEILMRKTQAEYESKPIRKADAETMLIQSSRIYKWAKDLIES